MKKSSTKPIKIFSALLVVLSILSQPVTVTIGDPGEWCSPYLGAPKEKGQPAYHFTGYGFPLVFITIVEAGCFENRITRTEWSLPGLGLDCLFLAIISSPLWLEWRKRIRT